MATGGFKSSATTDFLEEWKAKREKMRAKMLGDIAAATGAGSSGSSGNCRPSEEPQDPKSDSPDGGTPTDSPAPSEKSKEKKSSGPSTRKGKGQIEKRKLREKRRSTGVVSMPSNESLDELDDDDGVEIDRREEEEERLVLANTFQNEAMTADPASGLVSENPGRSANSRSKSCSSADEESQHRRDRRIGDETPESLEKRLEELEQELILQRQENQHLLKAHQEKDGVMEKLKDEMELLYRDLDDIEEENEQLKQENKTLLKVVGQLTR